jgi:hypothetical protein
MRSKFYIKFPPAQWYACTSTPAAVSFPPSAPYIPTSSRFTIRISYGGASIFLGDVSDATGLATFSIIASMTHFLSFRGTFRHDATFNFGALRFDELALFAASASDMRFDELPPISS